MREVVHDLFIALAFVLAVEWVITYHLKTRGTWRWSLMGRHLMVSMVTLTAVFGVLTAQAVAGLLEAGDPVWFQWMRTIGLASVPAVIAWRRTLLSRAQREDVDLSD